MKHKNTIHIQRKLFTTWQLEILFPCCNIVYIFLWPGLWVCFSLDRENLHKVLSVMFSICWGWANRAEFGASCWVCSTRRDDPDAHLPWKVAQIRITRLTASAPFSSYTQSALINSESKMWFDLAKVGKTVDDCIWKTEPWMLLLAHAEGQRKQQRHKAEKRGWILYKLIPEQTLNLASRASVGVWWRKKYVQTELVEDCAHCSEQSGWSENQQWHDNLQFRDQTVCFHLTSPSRAEWTELHHRLCYKEQHE